MYVCVYMCMYVGELMRKCVIVCMRGLFCAYTCIHVCVGVCACVNVCVCARTRTHVRTQSAPLRKLFQQTTKSQSHWMNGPHSYAEREQEVRGNNFKSKTAAKQVTKQFLK